MRKSNRHAPSYCRGAVSSDRRSLEKVFDQPLFPPPSIAFSTSGRRSPLRMSDEMQSEVTAVRKAWWAPGTGAKTLKPFCPPGRSPATFGQLALYQKNRRLFESSIPARLYLGGSTGASLDDLTIVSDLVTAKVVPAIIINIKVDRIVIPGKSTSTSPSSNLIWRSLFLKPFSFGLPFYIWRVRTFLDRVCFWRLWSETSSRIVSPASRPERTSTFLGPECPSLTRIFLGLPLFVGLNTYCFL